MAPTTRSRGRTEANPEPKSTAKLKPKPATHVYVLIDKTPRNLGPGVSFKAREAKKNLAVQGKPKGKGRAKIEVVIETEPHRKTSRPAAIPETRGADKATEEPRETLRRTRGRGMIKTKGKARANLASTTGGTGDAEPLPPSAADACRPVMPAPIPNQPKTTIVEGIPTPSQSLQSSQGPSQAVVVPFSAENEFVFATPDQTHSSPFRPPSTPHRDLTVIGRISSLPPSSPIPYTSSPAALPAPARRSFGTAGDFSAYLAAHQDWDTPEDDDDLMLPVLGDNDKENPFQWSDEDKENQAPAEEEDKENEIPDSEQDKENRFEGFHSEDLFSPGLKRKFGSDDEENEQIVSVPVAEEINPFDVGMEDDPLTPDSDKENGPPPPQAHSHYGVRPDGGRGDFDIPIPSSDRGILQPRPPTPSQLHRNKQRKLMAQEDPFGFFAAEIKLKARRLAQGGPARAQHSTAAAHAGPSTETLPVATSSALLPSTMYSGGVPSTPVRKGGYATAWDAWSPRTPRMVKQDSLSAAGGHGDDDDMEDMYMTPPAREPTHTPRTPRLDRALESVITPRRGEARDEGEVTMRKRRRKGSGVRSEVPEGSESESGATGMSSPSPVKRRSSGGSAETIMDVEREQEEEEEDKDERPRKRLRTQEPHDQRREKRATKGKGKVKPKAKVDEDPQAITKRLEKLLPTRPSKRAATTTAHVDEDSISERDDSDDDEEAGRGRGRSTTRATRARSQGRSRGRGRGQSRGRGRGRGRSRSEGSRRRKPAEVSTDEEVREVGILFTLWRVRF